MNTRWCNISSFNVFKILLQRDGNSARFSARWRSEGIVSSATGGVVWTIVILVQNDREKGKEKEKEKNIADGPCPSSARASPTIAVP